MLKTDDAVSQYLDELLHEPKPTPVSAPAANAPKAEAVKVEAPRVEAPTQTAAAPTPVTVATPAPAAPPVATVMPPAPRESRRRASDRMNRWIGFQVAGQNFGVEVLAVLEVQRVSEITAAPGAPPDLLGAINLRGQIVPVLDLGQRLGFGKRELTAQSRMIVVDYQGQPVGLCVDGVSEVVTAKVSSVERPPRLGGRVDAGWIQGVLRHKGEAILLLDPVKLLADVEVG
jgi:purine-binding chemotaxis protein CheW